MFTEGAEVIEVRAASTNPWCPAPYRVVAARHELGDTVTLGLAPITGTLPSFEPGQFNMLYAFGIGEIAISLSGVSDHRDCFTHTVRRVGAVSGALADLEIGDQVGVRGPFGSSWPVSQAEGADVVFVAGGLGLAPLRPAILAVLARRQRFGRVAILVGSRHPADILYRRELEQWRQRLDVDVSVTVDHADQDWHGNVGVVPGLLARTAFDPSETIALVCGPEIMMRFTARALRDAGLSDQRIFLSMERNMKCAIGQCGHCQFGPDFVCKDGPVMRLDRIAPLLRVREI
jgi:NAD(P)H-flavin reductase